MDRLLKDCRKNIKNVEYRRVLHCKYEHNDPNEKHYWRNLINQVEQLAKTKAVQSRVRCIDLWEPLPPKLRARVAKFIKIPADTEDESSEDLNDVDEPPEIKKPVSDTPIVLIFSDPHTHSLRKNTSMRAPCPRSWNKNESIVKFTSKLILVLRNEKSPFLT